MPARIFLVLAFFAQSLWAAPTDIMPIDDGPPPCDPSTACSPGMCGGYSDFNGCYYDCGGCASGELCSGNWCYTACTPTTSCAAQGKNCGSIFDGCTTVACGGCAAGWSCSASSVCTPPPPPPPPDGETLCSGFRVYASSEEPSIFDMVCGVGTLNGQPAVNWLNHWFVLNSSGLNGWTLVNDATGVTQLAVAPQDVETGGVVDDPNNDADVDLGFAMGTRPTRPPPPVHTLPTVRTRTYSFNIGGRQFTFAGVQNVFDHLVNASQSLQIRGEVSFTLTTPEPADGTTWTVSVTPERTLPHADPVAAEPGAEAAEQAGSSAIGNTYALFGGRNVIFSTLVDLVSAARTKPFRGTQATAPTNPAMNQAIAGMMGTPAPLYSVFQDQALNFSGSVLGVSGSSLVSYDKQRTAQFFLASRDSSGFSNPGVDRPLIDSAAFELTFRQPIVHYDKSFPFLAGICGLTVNVDSYLEGSFQAGTDTCFNGIFTSASASGNLSFVLDAGGGFGCSIIVASASAGLQSHVQETVQFSSSVQIAPPALNASVQLYSELDFQAFFRVRVLFWSHKWSKTLAHTSIFQREVDYHLLPQVPDVDVCSLTDSTDGDESTDGFRPTSGCDAPSTCRASPGSPGNPATCPGVGSNTACVAGTGNPINPGAIFSYPVPALFALNNSATFANLNGACGAALDAPRVSATGVHHTHPGVDLWAPRGTPVTAAASGLVVSVRESPFSNAAAPAGIEVVVLTRKLCPTCKDFLSYYMHLDSVNPIIGTFSQFGVPVPVVQGQVLGTAGITGDACQQQLLHFQVKDTGGQPYNVATFFNSLTPPL